MMYNVQSISFVFEATPLCKAFIINGSKIAISIFLLRICASGYISVWLQECAFCTWKKQKQQQQQQQHIHREGRVHYLNFLIKAVINLSCPTASRNNFALKVQFHRMHKYLHFVVHFFYVTWHVLNFTWTKWFIDYFQPITFQLLARRIDFIIER